MLLLALMRFPAGLAADRFLSVIILIFSLSPLLLPAGFDKGYYYTVGNASRAPVVFRAWVYSPPSRKLQSLKGYQTIRSTPAEQKEEGSGRQNKTKQKQNSNKIRERERERGGGGGER